MGKVEFCDSKGRPNTGFLMWLSCKLYAENMLSYYIQIYFPQSDGGVQLGMQKNPGE